MVPGARIELAQPEGRGILSRISANHSKSFKIIICLLFRWLVCIMNHLKSLNLPLNNGSSGDYVGTDLEL